MKKAIYFILFLATGGMLGYTLYYTSTHQATEVTFVTTATSTDNASSSEQAVNEGKTEKLTTKTGKSITLKETNPLGQSVSSITLTPEGFADNTVISTDTNKLTKQLLVDLNNDGYDELVLITTAAGSGSYGKAVIYTTNKDKGLLPVLVPEITEKDTEPGALFEGYMGHDTFSVVDGVLTQEFPTYTKNDTNASSTGQPKKILYIFSQKESGYSITFAPVTEKGNSLSTGTTTSPLSETSWIWVSARTEGKTLQAPTGNKFIISFGKGGKMTGLSPCNNVSGGYVTKNDSLQFGAFTMTPITCSSEKEIEIQYYTLLTKVNKYKHTSTSLTLTLANGDTLIFKNK